MKFLDKMAINMAHKAIVYVSGIILIFSIFVKVQVLDNTKIMIFSAVTFLYGISLWNIKDTLSEYGDWAVAYREKYIARAELKRLFIHLAYTILLLLAILYGTNIIKIK